jgi:hypothetical protein
MPKLAKGQTLAEAIQVREDKVRQLKTDTRRIEALPLPSAVIRKRMREQIASIGTLGAASAARLMTDGDIAFPQISHNVPAKLITGTDAAMVSWEQADVFALMIALNQDRVVALLDADITARALDADAMGPEQKERALAAVADEQLAIDREIAELVFLAHAEGVGGIELRADAHPLAVLSVAPVTVPWGETESPGSFPGYSWTVKR